jgi:hypothetical protein
MAGAKPKKFVYVEAYFPNLRDCTFKINGAERKTYRHMQLCRVLATLGISTTLTHQPPDLHVVKKVYTTRHQNLQQSAV